MDMNIRYWFGRELQIHCGEGFGLFLNRRNAEGKWCWKRTFFHFRVENLNN